MFSLRDLLFVISIYYVRKGLWAFCLNYPQINEACLCTDIAFMLIFNRKKRDIMRPARQTGLESWTQMKLVQDWMKKALSDAIS